MTTPGYEAAVGRLRGIRATLDPEIEREVVVPRAEVLARFQPVFAPEHLPALGPEGFRDFLLIENNHHWTGLQRHLPKMCADMPRLREALAILLDEAQPIESRFDRSLAMVRGMGKAVATAILLVAYPEKYGVWNGTSEEGIKDLGLWPSFPYGESLGGRYRRLNDLLVSLARDVGVDLWTLDALFWWQVRRTEEAQEGGQEGGTLIEALDRGAQGFGLERHLQEFLRDNWSRTELGRDWAILTDESDEEVGYEYPTGVGRIDILAKHLREPRWLVVELKRDQTSDATVGQVLRYMGWVRQHLAGGGEGVEGLVISRQDDQALRYALSAAADATHRLYEVEFRLRPS